jgi:hypothetical protein
VATTASAETFRFPTLGGHYYLEGLDGVVAVEHSAEETGGITDCVLDAFPGWRVRTLSSGSEAELSALTLFAHPAASAARLGFSDGPGDAPAASSTLAELAAVLSTGDFFLSPVLVRSDGFFVVANVLEMIFRHESDLEDRLALIESVGGVVLARDDRSPGPRYLVRLEGARTAFEAMETAEALMAHAEVFEAMNQFRSVRLEGCGGSGSGGGGTGSSGGTGGGAAAVAVPAAGETALAGFAALLVFAGLVALGPRRE